MRAAAANGSLIVFRHFGQAFGLKKVYHFPEGTATLVALADLIADNDLISEDRGHTLVFRDRVQGHVNFRFALKGCL